jgi:Ca2+-binding RTX toxin-like protein
MPARNNHILIFVVNDALPKFIKVNAMATVKFYSGMNMNKFDWFAWPEGGVTDYDSSQIALVEPGLGSGFGVTESSVFGGSFDIDSYTDSNGGSNFMGVGGGTLSSYTYYVDDLIDVSITGFSFDAVAAFNYVKLGEDKDTKDYNLELLRLILSGSDTITGSYFDDKLLGFGGNDVINGGYRQDVLKGGGGNDSLFGDRGDDILSGGNGDDILSGGTGVDAMTGNAGADSFRFLSLSEAGDEITDFVSGEDTLSFSGAALGLAAGGLAAGQLERNTTNIASDADVRFIYNTDTGVLRFDSNGSANGGVTVIATLDGAPDLSRFDFIIL